MWKVEKLFTLSLYFRLFSFSASLFLSSRKFASKFILEIHMKISQTYAAEKSAMVRLILREFSSYMKASSKLPYVTTFLEDFSSFFDFSFSSFGRMWWQQVNGVNLSERRRKMWFLCCRFMILFCAENLIDEVSERRSAQVSTRATRRRSYSRIMKKVKVASHLAD